VQLSSWASASGHDPLPRRVPFGEDVNPPRAKTSLDRDVDQSESSGRHGISSNTSTDALAWRENHRHGGVSEVVDRICKNHCFRALQDDGKVRGRNAGVLEQPQVMLLPSCRHQLLNEGLRELLLNEARDSFNEVRDGFPVSAHSTPNVLPLSRGNRARKSNALGTHVAAVDVGCSGRVGRPF
jgi:hypothetical protein